MREKTQGQLELQQRIQNVVKRTSLTAEQKQDCAAYIYMKLEQYANQPISPKIIMFRLRDFIRVESRRAARQVDLGLNEWRPECAHDPYEQIDLVLFLATLPLHLRKVAEAIGSHNTQADAAKAIGISLRQFKKRLKELRALAEAL